MAKAFSWSYSRYKNFFTCPKRYYEVDVLKNFKESSEQLEWGNVVHDALRDACLGKTSLPDSMKDYQRWVDEMVDYPGKPGTLIVEQQLAITKDFQPTAWFAPNVWFRAIVDAARIDGGAAFVRDWKTGKTTHDSRQLMLNSQAIFVHYPKVRRINTQFVWLKDDCKTEETFNRSTIMQEWPPILEAVKQMERAALTLTYPPQPGRLCRSFCPVTSCPFFGKRT